MTSIAAQNEVEAYADTLRKGDAFVRAHALIKAAKEGSVWKTGTAIGVMREQGAFMQGHAEQALGMACYYGHMEVVKVLLDEGGVNINCFFFDQENPSVTIHAYPLYKAMEGAQWAVADELLARGASMQGSRDDLFYFAARGKNTTMLKRMIEEYGFSPAEENCSETTLQCIAKWTDRDFFLYLTQKGLSVKDGAAKLMKAERVDLLKDLILSGFLPTEDMTALAALFVSTHPHPLRSLIEAWREQTPDMRMMQREENWARYSGLLADPDLSFASRVLPATLMGDFNKVVRPNFDKVTPDMLLTQDANGDCVISVLMKDNALKDIFDASLWKGREKDLGLLQSGLPPVVARGCEGDIEMVFSTLARARLPARQKRYQLGFTRGGLP